MDLNEYIKMSYQRPNKTILESLGASEGLIEYLLHTPWNTNISMLNNWIDEESDIWACTTGDNGGEAAIYANGESEISEYFMNFKTYEDWKSIFDNPEKYKVVIRPNEDKTIKYEALYNDDPEQAEVGWTLNLTDPDTHNMVIKLEISNDIYGECILMSLYTETYFEQQVNICVEEK